MENLRILISYEDGSESDLEYDTGMQFIQAIAGDDFSAPPRHMAIEATTDEGKIVVISIPYSASDSASVAIREIGELE